MGTNKKLDGFASDMVDEHSDNCTDCCQTGNNFGTGFGRRILWTLLGVLIVYSVFYIGAQTRNALKNYGYIGQSPYSERMITVAGYGKISGNNDIAMTSIGFSNIDADVATAQAANKKVMDGVFVDLKSMGIADKDVTTNYSIYPEYNYTQDRGQELKGYRVANTLQIKIRDLSKIPAVLGLAGKHGANQVGGLSFTIDDPENLKAQARDKALADAQQKAASLAARLGVQLVEIVSYNDYEGQPGYPVSPMYLKEGMGGGGGVDVAPSAVSSGSQDVVMNVNITYKIASPNW